MNLLVPILVEERGGQFVARPLLRTEPVQRAERLSRAVTKLTDELLRLLHLAAEESRHDELAEWCQAPMLEERTLELRLELPSGPLKRAFLFAGYTALGRQLWMTPGLPEMRFEVRAGERLEDRATEVLTRRFRELEREGQLDVESFALEGKALVTWVELEIEPAGRSKKKSSSGRASLFGQEEGKDGEAELRRVGTLLGRGDSGPGRIVGRDREVDELARCLAGTERRPVVLVGPRLVGKTALVEEVARRARERKAERHAGGRDIWHLSPMRLISGMSVVGEWEDRVVAILDHARGRDRVLFFDDVPGLFAAGVTNASDLSVAHVLKPVLERRSVRVLAEATPEAWRVVRERDRAFADLFQVIPVSEPTEAETLRILIHLARNWEGQAGCGFELDVVPTVYDLQRRYAGDAVFPGKAAATLRRLATALAGKRIDRDAVLRDFEEQTGLGHAFTDERVLLQRDELLAALGRELVGQPAVLGAFADALVKLKARLNDPRRPLAVLLLLGPTGVGKTQSAKALARVLFGSADRLLRFDLNEFVDASSVARLTGTRWEPEGLLTGAIRRQPFSVVLFDEVEKAAPEVFDLLLAVLDEGRLTDAVGRVADFTRSVILLTSNLGARESRSRLGFGVGESARDIDDVYVGAAEKFFRPEFFNRLDRVVAFRPLGRGHLEGIARGLIGDLGGRDGLRRRGGGLELTPAAVQRLIELGHHPELGARALKRAIEREVVQPLAARLAAIPPSTYTLATLDASAAGFEFEVCGVEPEGRTVDWPRRGAGDAWPDAEGESAALEACGTVLKRIARSLERHAPAGPIPLQALSPEEAWYFACREQWGRAERRWHAMCALRTAGSGSPRVVGRTPRKPTSKVIPRGDYAKDPRLGRLRAATSLQHAMAELESDAAPSTEATWSDLLRELAALDMLAGPPADRRAVMLILHAESAAAKVRARELARFWQECADGAWGWRARLPGTEEGPEASDSAVLIEGIRVARWWEAGRTLAMIEDREGGAGALLQVEAVVVADESEARRVLAGMRDGGRGPRREAWIRTRYVWAGPKPGLWTDVRTGMMAAVAVSNRAEMRALWASALPLPPECRAFENGSGTGSRAERGQT